MARHIFPPKDQISDEGIRNKVLDKMLDTQVFGGNAADNGDFGPKRARCQSIGIDAPHYGNGNRFSGV